jgi:hypothetical protein
VAAAFTVEPIEERILCGEFEQRRISERLCEAARERGLADANGTFYRDEARQFSFVDICDRRRH